MSVADAARRIAKARCLPVVVNLIDGRPKVADEVFDTIFCDDVKPWAG